MSCLNVKATLLNLPVVVGISLLSGIECSASVLNPPLKVSVMDVTPKLKVSGHLVCSVGGGSFVRFKESLIAWYGADNNNGVIKYNTLIASGNWSLEEVEIEELL